jgi:tRNA(Ile)-lysidine synthase
LAKSTLKKNELAAQVAEKLQAWVGPAARLVVGVSGGADSVALLHLLAADKDRRHRLLAVHVNHGLRGAQAQRDEAFVVSLCTRWGVPCKVYAPDVRGAAAGRKWSVEEAGRKLRQECFLLAAREFGAQAVLLAHHRDDQAETVLFNFLRGTGLRGLGGMLPVRVFPHPGAPAGLKLIRPLLEVAKADLTAYCRSQHLTWRHDQSNEDTNFSRNRIRRRLIPWLEKNFNPALRLVLARAAESAARDEAWLEELSQRALRACAPASTTARITLARSRLAALAEPLRRRVLSQVWDQLGIPHKSQAHLANLERALEQAGTYTGHLPGKWRVRQGAKYLEIFKTPDKKRTTAPASLDHPAFSGVYMEKCPVPSQGGKLPKNSPYIYVDAGKITGELICRSRRPGDTMCPLGLSGQHKEVKKIFMEMRVPAAKRAVWPLLVMGKEIIWVYRGPMAESVKLDGKTRQALKLILKRG